MPVDIDNGFRHTATDLKQLQSLPLDAKIAATKHRIQQWVDVFGVSGCYLSFSGGKDSTVLLYILREMMGYTQSQIPAVFSNTGLEYAQLQSFAKACGAKIITPETQFNKVVSLYGYPIISKEASSAIYYARKIRHSGAGNGASQQSFRRKSLLGDLYMPARIMPDGTVTMSGNKSMFNKTKWLAACYELPYMITDKCCIITKKAPLHSYNRTSGRKPILATTAEESRSRKQSWLQNGCNAFTGKDPKSQPMAFWTEQDVLKFIHTYHVDICSVYGDVVGQQGSYHCTQCSRTGCVYCMFGAHHSDDTRFLELQKLSPRQYEYAFSGGQWVDNPAYDPTAPKMDGDWQNWNPKKIWVPSKQGLGLKFVIDEFNQLYPKNQIQY